MSKFAYVLSNSCCAFKICYILGMDTNTRKDLQKLVASHCKTGDFTLSSGKQSDFYINLREPLSYYWPLNTLGKHLHQEVCRPLNANTYAGPAAAAIPLMTAALFAATQLSASKMCYTRSSKKEHGLKNSIEGPALTSEDRIILVDDVLTTGGSLIKCGQTLLEAYPDCQIVGAWVVVDRQEGGFSCCKKSHGML